MADNDKRSNHSIIKPGYLLELKEELIAWKGITIDDIEAKGGHENYLVKHSRINMIASHRLVLTPGLFLLVTKVKNMTAIDGMNENKDIQVKQIYCMDVLYMHELVYTALREKFVRTAINIHVNDSL